MDAILQRQANLGDRSMIYRKSVPREGGDGPLLSGQYDEAERCSPHTRGPRSVAIGRKD